MTPWIRLDAPRLLPRGRRPSAARFVERPHRFAAVATLADGTRVEAHVANPGRLTGVLPPGCEILVDGPLPPPRALRYNALAARRGRTWVGLVTTYANRVFPALLRAGLFPELSDGVTRAEVPHGRSRFDFLAGARLVEVKSVSLADGRAGLFPDAVTARGAKHCDELARLARRGTPTAIVFVAQRGDVGSVSPAEQIDPDFARALRKAARAGVLVLACALRLGTTGATAARRVEVKNL